MTHKSSFLESFLRLNPSSFYVATVGAGIFVVGHYAADLYSWASQQDTFAQKVLGSIALGASPTLVKMVDWRISKDKENAVNEAIKKEREPIEKAINAHKEKFRGYINELLEVIEELEIPRELKKQISQGADQAYRDTNFFFRDLEHFLEIANWLNITVNGKKFGNRYPLINSALDKAKVNSNIENKFEIDIKNCIQWLHDSLEYGNPCKFDRYQASALFDGELSAKPYVLALNTIRDLIINERKLNQNSRHSIIVDYMIQNLIEKFEGVVI